MGMFDSIRVPGYEGIHAQTKALTNVCNLYGLGYAVPLKHLPVYDADGVRIQKYVHEKDFSFLAHIYPKGEDAIPVHVLVEDGVIVAFGKESDVVRYDNRGEVIWECQEHAEQSLSRAKAAFVSRQWSQALRQGVEDGNMDKPIRSRNKIMSDAGEEFERMVESLRESASTQEHRDFMRSLSSQHRH